MHGIDATTIQRLYPPDGSARSALRGLYLAPPLPPEPGQKTWLYANFVTSLDGLISQGQDATVCRVPTSVANLRDWRLFQELAARADCLLTSGRYMRDLAAGSAQDLLPIGEAYSDLSAWRTAAGLTPQPDIAILSRSLDFPLPPLFIEQGRRVWIFVAEGADSQRLAALEQAGAAVAGRFSSSQISGAQVRAALGSLGYQRIYSVAGAQVAHALMADHSLDSLFLTVRHRVIGGNGAGDRGETIVTGPALHPPNDFELRWLYLDSAADGPGQHFSRYDRIAPT